MLANEIKELIVTDIKKRIFDESFPRIIQCLDILNENEIWIRSNENSNSIGNLVLHLCGNIRQYIICGVGNNVDLRNRSLEFSERGPLSKAVLKTKIETLWTDIRPVLDAIKAEDMILKKTVQGFDMNVCSILIHVTEHLSYHTGQIAFFTKQIKNLDLKFYGDLDLDITA